MNVFSLLGHIGLLIHMGKDVQTIIGNLVQRKESFPSKDEFLELLDDAISLVTSGLLNLPDDVSKTISNSLSGVKSEIAGLPKAA